jgi:hypothetical protein
LPTNWNQVSALAQGSGGAYGSLSVNIQSIAGSNAVLSPRQLAALAPAGQQQILAQRQWSATRLAISQSALATASSRFSALQTLINAMSSATDQKGILDLQARINAELGMLENEQSEAAGAVAGVRCARGRTAPAAARTGDRRSRQFRGPLPAGSIGGSRGRRQHRCIMGFFATFWSWLNTQLGAYIGDNTARLAGVLEPAIVSLATIYVMGWGYLHLTGKLEEPVVAGLKRLIVLAVVLGVSLRLWLYNA